MGLNAVAVPAPLTAVGEAGLWDTVLRRYSAILDAQRAFIVFLLEENLPADSYELPVAFEPPKDMPPMPLELRAVAATLQGETDELIIDAKALRARSDAHATSRARPAAHSTPSAMDRRL